MKQGKIIAWHPLDVLVDSIIVRLPGKLCSNGKATAVCRGFVAVRDPD
jgi:hypothetical protein